MSDDYAIGQRTGAAANQAASVLTGSFRLLADGTLTVDQLVQIHLQLAEGFFKNMETIQAAQSIADAFPGTTAVPQQAFAQAAPAPAQQAPAFTPANVAQGPWPAQQQAAVQAAVQGQNFQAAPGVGGNKADQEWMALFNNPSGFYDNRQDKKSPGAPDFKNKQSGDGLWLNGKFGSAPQWVFDRLQGGFGPVQ
jgi:hypothetical protein